MITKQSKAVVIALSAWPVTCPAAAGGGQLLGAHEDTALP